LKILKKQQSLAPVYSRYSSKVHCTGLIYTRLQWIIRRCYVKGLLSTELSVYDVLLFLMFQVRVKQLVLEDGSQIIEFSEL